MSAPDSNRPRLVLIVDDEEFNRDLLEALVESLGHRSICAANGRQALGVLTPEVDLVLVDAMMPVMDGFAVTRAIREDERYVQLPIIMVTALTGKEDRLRAVEAGANDFVTKPIDRTELRVRMTSLLKMKEAQDAVRRISDNLRRQNEQMAADLNLAREIQQAFLPEPLSWVPATAAQHEALLIFHHHYSAADELGGDFAEVLPLSPTSAGVLVCDVMGHGVRSALITAIMRGLIEDLSHLATKPGQFLSALNRGVSQTLERSSTPLFVTAFYVLADVACSTLCCSSAGHPSALMLRAGSDEVIELAPGSPGPALGIFADTVFEEQRWPLATGDRVLLFTDGLSEKSNELGEEFGDQRVTETLLTHADSPPEELCAALLTAAVQFAGSGEFDDDVCLLLLEVNGTKRDHK